MNFYMHFMFRKEMISVLFKIPQFLFFFAWFFWWYFPFLCLKNIFYVNERHFGWANMQKEKYYLLHMLSKWVRVEQKEWEKWNYVEFQWDAIHFSRNSIQILWFFMSSSCVFIYFFFFPRYSSENSQNSGHFCFSFSNWIDKRMGDFQLKMKIFFFSSLQNFILLTTKEEKSEIAHIDFSSDLALVLPDMLLANVIATNLNVCWKNKKNMKIFSFSVRFLVCLNKSFQQNET